MKQFRGFTFFIYTVLVSEVRFAHAHSNPYYELWTNKFESVRLEMQILRDKITEGEKQLGETKSKLALLETSCSANQKDIGVEEKGMKAIGSDQHGIEKKRDEYTILHQAFVQQKLYNRRLGKQLGESSTKIDEIKAEHRQQIAELEAKQGQKIAELETKHGRKIAELEAKSHKDITTIQDALESLATKTADITSKLETAANENTRLPANILHKLFFS